MKKLLFFVSAAMLLGTVACQKDADKTYDGEEGTGKVTVSFGFGSEETRAYTASAVKPTTTWQNNIDDVLLLLVDGTTIKVVREFPFTASGDHALQTQTFTNVPVGNYTGYVIANYKDAGIATDWTATTLQNTNINTLIFKLVANAGYVAGPLEGTANAYNEPGEIFLSTQTGIDVVANTSTDYSTTKPFALTRAISLLRVRINKNFADDAATPAWDNSLVEFDDANAAIRLRKAGTSFLYTGVVSPATTVGTDLIYSKGAFNTSATNPTGYSTGLMLDVSNGQTEWKDIRILPGGATGLGANKFNIVISGMAPAGYLPAGSTTPLTTPTILHWAGTINGAITANAILQLDIDVTTQGLPDVPKYTETGSINIGVDLIEWGAIVGAEPLPVR